MPHDREYCQRLNSDIGIIRGLYCRPERYFSTIFQTWGKQGLYAINAPDCGALRVLTMWWIAQLWVGDLSVFLWQLRRFEPALHKAFYRQSCSLSLPDLSGVRSLRIWYTYTKVYAHETNSASNKAAAQREHTERADENDVFRCRCTAVFWYRTNAFNTTGTPLCSIHIMGWGARDSAVVW